MGLKINEQDTKAHSIMHLLLPVPSEKIAKRGSVSEVIKHRCLEMNTVLRMML